MNNKTIFISYSWKDDFIADRIGDDLEYLGFNVILDKKKMKYTDSIPAYMERIRKEDYVLILVSDHYLKSENCMKELVAFQKDDRWNVLLPVILRDTKLYRLEDRIGYAKYWEERIATQEALLRQVEPWNAALESRKFQTIREISYNVSNFMANLVDAILATPEELWRDHYRNLKGKIHLNGEDERDWLLKPISNKQLQQILASHTEIHLLDLSRCNLSNKILEFNNIDLSCANFKYSNLRNSNIINADFSGCNLQWADFTAARFRYVSFCNADLRGADFTGIKYEALKIRGGDFSYSTMDDNFRAYVISHGGIVDEN